MVRSRQHEQQAAAQNAHQVRGREAQPDALEQRVRVGVLRAGPHAARPGGQRLGCVVTGPGRHDREAQEYYPELEGQARVRLGVADVGERRVAPAVQALMDSPDERGPHRGQHAQRSEGGRQEYAHRADRGGGCGGDGMHAAGVDQAVGRVQGLDGVVLETQAGPVHAEQVGVEVGLASEAPQHLLECLRLARLFDTGGRGRRGAAQRGRGLDPEEDQRRHVHAHHLADEQCKPHDERGQVVRHRRPVRGEVEGGRDGHVVDEALGSADAAQLQIDRHQRGRAR
mmetsp:Transcript_20319/g.63784  ORF Transcript_20319/g.63784 Transcript_20319/m.63784 type:complete len:284 (+) Transcript_20319:2749-3600(+)